MPEYYYHGSPMELSELQEPYRGRGIFLTPAQSLAAMFGLMRDVKRKTNGFGHAWTMNLFDDYDKTGNDEPRAFEAYSDKSDMPETHGEGDVYVHKIRITPEIRKKLRKRPTTSRKHEVVYQGTRLPVESVYKVHLPWTAKYSKALEDEFMAIRNPGAKDDDTYSIHGAILGCLGNNADKFKYHVTEDLSDDPWKAIITTEPMTLDQVRKFHQLYNVDVDKVGVPYYFLTKNERTGGKAVWYSSANKPLPINTKKEEERARVAGRFMGIKPEQLDFKFNDNNNVKTSSAKLSSEINDLMNGYEWEAIDPISGEKIYSPGKGFFTTSNPVSYSYQGGGEKPFKGNCIEQSLFVREHYPDAKFLFSRDAKPGINHIHVTPLLQDANGYYHHVKLTPIKDKKGIQQYLSGGRFRNLKNFLKGTAHKWGDRDIDYYVLDDIPSEGDARSLLAYANEHADPIRIRGGKPLEKLRFQKNFQNIVDLYKQRFGIDLSNVKYYEDTYSQNTNGDFTNEYAPEESGGDWHSDHSVRINPKMEDVIKHWKLNTKLRPFVNWMMAHELAHDIEKNPEHQDLVRRMTEEAKKTGFTTPYLESVKRKYRNMETFCEYMAHQINQKPKKTKQANAAEDLVKELAPLAYKHPDYTQNIKQIFKDGYTSCWGVSRVALNRLRKAGLDPETVFIFEDEVPNLPTHQFTTYRDGDKFRVHDNFGQDGGIGPAFNTREEAIDERVKRWREHEKHYRPVHVYTGTRLPRTGEDSEEYMYRIMKLNPYLKTYPKLEK